MSKIITVTDEKTKEVEFCETITGTYAIQYVNNHDSGEIHQVSKIKNGRYNYKYWIKNEMYWDLVTAIYFNKTLKEKLKKIQIDRILFLEDEDYEPVNPKQNDWIARIKKANKELESLWGYWYVIETRACYMSKLNNNQITALIYEQLRRIDGEGGLNDFDVSGWSEMLATLGTEWNKENSFIDNILGSDFKWSYLSKNPKQIDLAEYMNSRDKVVN